MDQKSLHEIPHENQEFRLDNSGENRMLQTKTNQQNFVIKFEFTALRTPQQNSFVERNIPTLMGRSWAMMPMMVLKTILEKHYDVKQYQQQPNWTI